MRYFILVLCLISNLNSNAEDSKLITEQIRLQKILNSFITKISKDPAQYTLIVEQSEVINAYASAGRKIVVYTALIDSLKNESALAFVLAHELGHIEERHVINGVVRTGFLSLLKNLFFKTSRVYDGVAYMGELHYSRGAEQEADLFAAKLMNSLYCQTPGKLEFFENNVTKQKESKLSEYFSTHPLSRTRLEYLRKQISDAGCTV